MNNEEKKAKHNGKQRRGVPKSALVMVAFFIVVMITGQTLSAVFNFSDRYLYLFGCLLALLLGMPLIAYEVAKEFGEKKPIIWAMMAFFSTSIFVLFYLIFQMETVERFLDADREGAMLMHVAIYVVAPAIFVLYIFDAINKRVAIYMEKRRQGKGSGKNGSA